MRTVWLFPGFMEDEQIFSKLISQLPTDFGYKYADFRPVLAQFGSDKFSVEQFVLKMIAHYQIRPEDIVIGHSTGGWLAAWVNHIQQNQVILLSAFTDKEKVIAKSLLKYRWLRMLVVKSGLYYAGFVKRTMLRAYAHRPSIHAVEMLVRNYDSFDKKYVLKMLNIIASEERPTYTVLLRLHALKDRILSVPDEPFTEIPGDHFSLYSFPAETAKPIGDMLTNFEK